jgi:copper chaperone CopZ
MTEIKFKTTINCAGCIAKATDTLNNLAGKDQWTVDISNPNKILTIAKDQVDEDQLIKAVQGIGFKIEKINA